MTKRKAPGKKHIRLLSDGLIDESGLRWDRVPVTDGWFMTPVQAEPYLSAAARFLVTNGFGSRAEDVGRSAFMALLQDDPSPCLQAFRAADGSGRTISTMDKSDCYRT